MEERPLETGPKTLARSRRLTALVALKEHGGAITPAELATAVASRESGHPSTAVDEDHVERVLSSLRRRHLPALLDAGLLTVDADSRFESESDRNVSSGANSATEKRVALDADAADVRRILAVLFESESETEFESATEG